MLFKFICYFFVMVNTTKKSYDSLAELYDKKNLSGLANAYYERPAIVSLTPKDLSNKTVVDAGCGSGILSEYLEKQGAQVIAFDYSEGLINIAKKRLRSDNVRVANLENNLDFITDSSVDIIVSSLVLHYIENWNSIFEEFNRILKPNGCVIFSIHHPHQDWYWFNIPNYFEKTLCEDTWNLEGNKLTVHAYHRTLMEVFEIISEAKFYVEKLLEPKPLPEGKKIDEKFYHSLMTKPRFLFMKLKKL